MKLKKGRFSFKKLIFRFIFYCLAIPLFSFVFTENFNLEVLICIFGGIVIGTPLTYYFINGKSFKPVEFSDFLLTAILNIPVVAFFSTVVFFLIINL